MIITKLKIINYKKFQDITINFNEDVNIFVGNNDAGKTTILESISMVLTGRINGVNMMSKFTPDWFNYESRKKYVDSLATDNPEAPPQIVIEAFLKDDDNAKIQSYRGTNNIANEDSIGVKIEIKFNEDYTTAYRELLDNKKILDIPVEFYKIEYRTFANPDYYINTTAKKIGIIDTTKKDYGIVLNKFVSTSISSYLSEKEETDLRLAYRSNRRDFTESDAVKNLNAKIKESNLFDDKLISLNLKEHEIDGWKTEIALSINDIPFENLGFGSQNMLKSELFIMQSSDSEILLIEEPENNLSFTNMEIFIYKLSKCGKQVFISTHSSFVANKLGLNKLFLVCNNEISSLQSLSKDTYNFFLKLSGYNTLRLLLANKIILVEGPADELIIQKAFYDFKGKLPIEDGVDVMAIGGVAFARYCELAEIISKNIVVVTDNDGNCEKVKDKYSNLEHTTLCVETDNELNTLEPSVLNVNKDSFSEFKDIIYCGKDKSEKTIDEIKEFMKNNKTEWSMRVFESDKKIHYPRYILNAIGCSEDE